MGLAELSSLQSHSTLSTTVPAPRLLSCVAGYMLGGSVMLLLMAHCASEGAPQTTSICAADVWCRCRGRSPASHYRSNRYINAIYCPRSAPVMQQSPSHRPSPRAKHTPGNLLSEIAGIMDCACVGPSSWNHRRRPGRDGYQCCRVKTGNPILDLVPSPSSLAPRVPAEPNHAVGWREVLSKSQRPLGGLQPATLRPAALCSAARAMSAGAGAGSPCRF